MPAKFQACHEKCTCKVVYFICFSSKCVFSSLKWCLKNHSLVWMFVQPYFTGKIYDEVVVQCLAVPHIRPVKHYSAPFIHSFSVAQHCWSSPVHRARTCLCQRCPYPDLTTRILSFGLEHSISHLNLFHSFHNTIILRRKKTCLDL